MRKEGPGDGRVQSGFNSRDCVDVVLDVMLDTTVRPMRPELLQRALAEKERIEKWGTMEQSESKNGTQESN